MHREWTRSGELRTAKAFVTVRAIANEISECAADSDCSECPCAQGRT